ncbi:hypothetical protein AAFC00_005332 [Neodothiora populina]|uniref:26S proteasome complex subunit SEM1 n=1 Tax=Neodothiora populina TaxID=2781224 RepID=A0ABR3PKI4_9PEZI
MSGAAAPNSASTKSTTNDSKDVAAVPAQKPVAQLEEDDEFEDFPVEDWPAEEELGSSASGSASGTTHLWEESWDDDDTSDDFSLQLKEELEKMGGK